jgi:hypothetical protein
MLAQGGWLAGRGAFGYSLSASSYNTETEP